MPAVLLLAAALGTAAPASPSRAACEAGDGKACLAVVQELGAPRDDAVAADLYGRACGAEKPEARGCTLLGVLRRHGWGVEQDARHAASLFERACRGGDALGCEKAGRMYTLGEGVEADPARAAALSRQACDGGRTSACKAGNDAAGAAMDPRSCASGDVDACLELSLQALRERQPSGGTAAVRSFLRSACDAGDTAGCFLLGRSYDSGQPGARDADDVQAAFFLAKACAEGYSRGCLDLGKLHERKRHDADVVEAAYHKVCVLRGLLGCTKGRAGSVALLEGHFDDVRLAALYHAACDEGDADGCFSTGVLAERGAGRAVDFAQAARDYTKACDGGHPVGCHNLGFFHGEGQGVGKDEARAAALYEKACGRDFAPSCSNLGFRYETGAGVPADAARARRLFATGCAGGDQFGCESLARVLENGIGGAADAAAAARAHRRACALGAAASCDWAEEVELR